MEDLLALIARFGGTTSKVCLAAAAVWLGPAGVETAAQAEGAATNEPARIKVSGLGILGNREMARLLHNFQTDPRQRRALDRTFVEDAALVLLSRVNNAGYLNARLEARFTLPDGSQQQVVWTNAIEVQLPRDFAARAARFHIRRGVRFYYQSLDITGAQAIPEREARGYFISAGGLIRLRSQRVFSPGRLKESLAALREALARKGYRAATVTADALRQDNWTGAVSLIVRVEEGLPAIVRSVAVEVYGPADRSPIRSWTVRSGEPYSPLWQPDFARQLRHEQYARGFANAAVEFSTLERETNAVAVHLDLKARVDTGRIIFLRDVRFEGNRHTRSSVLDRRVRLEKGDPLNRLQAEQARQRLARLGVFDWVSLRYDTVNDTTRDVAFELKEGKRIAVSLLAGYGSYEQLRGGLEFEHRNFLGYAHVVRLRGLQSFKATSGDLLYTVPEFLFENTDFFVRGSGLRREEVSFTREEFGGAAGVHHRLNAIGADLAVRYDYEFLNALDVTAAGADQIAVTEARAAAFVIDFHRDRRDHPLVPRRGLKLFGNVEFASASLGGNVDYQRLVVGGSFHQPLGPSQFLHLGVTHGLTFTLGGEHSELPFNKRFIPGGEDSVRGYQQGEASPLDDRGRQLGAETYAQANLEFEQLLTPAWSLIAFFDAAGFARDRADYPWDEGLFSIGGGIRWRTIIGPVRLEYGYNLNRRRHDPSGTLHVSIGFPF